MRRAVYSVRSHAPDNYTDYSTVKRSRLRPQSLTNPPSPVYIGYDTPGFPVDTHIWRVTRRLGWIAPRASREQARILLEALVPPELYYPLHLNLLAHGRAICQARRPQCEVCPLKGECEYYHQVQRSIS